MKPNVLLDFWKEIGPEGWYSGSPEVDKACLKFKADCEMARAGAYKSWLSRPETSLAYLILTDQIPRNIFRNQAEAFATDALARAGADCAVAFGHDMRIDGPIRQFFYLPYEHAENRQAQSRAVTLFMLRMPDTRDTLWLHARAHRDIIRRFGRFPARNQALGRRSSDAELKFLQEEGYAGILERLSN